MSSCFSSVFSLPFRALSAIASVCNIANIFRFTSQLFIKSEPSQAREDKIRNTSL